MAQNRCLYVGLPLTDATTTDSQKILPRNVEFRRRVSFLTPGANPRWKRSLPHVDIVLSLTPELKHRDSLTCAAVTSIKNKDIHSGGTLLISYSTILFYARAILRDVTIQKSEEFFFFCWSIASVHANKGEVW